MKKIIKLIKDKFNEKKEFEKELEKLQEKGWHVHSL